MWTETPYSSPTESAAPDSYRYNRNGQSSRRNFPREARRHFRGRNIPALSTLELVRARSREFRERPASSERNSIVVRIHNGSRVTAIRPLHLRPIGKFVGAPNGLGRVVYGSILGQFRGNTGSWDESRILYFQLRHPSSRRQIRGAMLII
jgi:hypothetical protein